MNEEIDTQKAENFLKTAPRWMFVALNTLAWITLLIIIGVLAFYKGMIYQCHELNMVAYSVNDGWFGFECAEKKSALDYTNPFTIVPNLSQEYIAHGIHAT